MIYKVFSIYDVAVKSYMQPFFMKSIGEAERALKGLVNDEKHNFSKYAQDFTLFDLGSFDETNGRFTMHSSPVSIAVLIEYKDLVSEKLVSVSS